MPALRYRRSSSVTVDLSCRSENGPLELISRLKGPDRGIPERWSTSERSTPLPVNWAA
jgi:hypothetical protein